MVEESYWSRLRTSGTTRRKLMQSAAIGGAGVAALAAFGCSTSQSPSTTGGTSGAGGTQPKRGGTIVHKLGETQESYSNGFDAHILNAAYTSLMGFFYQNLVRYHPVTLEIEPEMATKWEQVSPTEFSFTLAPGIKWQNKAPVNGRELTAQDVIYNLERARTNEPRFINRALLGSIDKLEAPNKSTVRMTLKQPDVTALSAVADVSVVIMAPEVLEKYDKLTTAEHVVGSGAFMLKDYQPDVGADLVRNPDYWKAGLPYLDGIKLSNIKDTQAAFSAFLVGQMDVTIVPGEQAKKFVAEQGNKFTTDWAEDVAPQVFWVNTKRKPYDDKRVQRALRLLIDHSDAIRGWAEVFYGRGTLVGTSHLPSILKSWDFTEEEYTKAASPLFLEWKQPKDDAAREALSLLSAAGYNRDNPLLVTEHNSSTSQTTESGAQLCQAMLTRLSQNVVRTELKFFENVVHIGMMNRGEFEIAGPVARAGYIEPDQILRQVYHSTGSQNFGKWSDPKADELIDKQRAIFNLQERRGVVKEILTHLIQNAPYTGWGANAYLNAAQPRLKEFFPEHRSRWRANLYESMWLDV
jgi:peptide/nickel transport system substrate-binding protein